ncbi:MAG: hypothetical protein GY718_09990 [Lentisphaerae bacterium]|nr:hypothetical protein [Lentisphaerota bacterium]
MKSLTKETTNNIKKLKNKVPFVWGKIVEIYTIDDYDIAVFHPLFYINGKAINDVYDEHVIEYHGWVNGRDTCRSWPTLDEALAGCLSYKYEGANGKADIYFIKALEAIRRDRNENKS